MQEHAALHKFTLAWRESLRPRNNQGGIGPTSSGSSVGQSAESLTAIDDEDRAITATQRSTELSKMVEGADQDAMLSDPSAENRHRQ